jgi:mono/diheme cytochrome c family protein
VAKIPVMRAIPVALVGLLVVGAPQPRAENTVAHWGKVSVELPVSQTPFPAAEGAVIANSQCLICHSADMVLRQPAQTQEQWKEIINKMRSGYGAPLPAGQVDALAAYLSRLVPGGNGS